MKLIKNMLFKRIVIYLCCTVLFSSSVFMAYTMPVYAETTYADLLEDALYIAGAAAGIYFSGGTLTPALLVPFIERLAGTGFDVYDYVTQDEESGTTTISADFVNLVLQAYKEYKEDNGEKFDGVMNPGIDGYYHYDSVSVSVFLGAGNTTNLNSVFTDFNTYYPCAVWVISGQLNSNNMGLYRFHLVFYDKGTDTFFSAYVNNNTIPKSDLQNLSDFEQILEGSLYLNKPHYLFKNVNGTENGEGYPFTRCDVMMGAILNTAYAEASSSSIPIYHSLSALKEGLRTGDFSAAYNYGKPVSSGESSSYTGEYTGGDITVLTEKLNGISDKLKEIDDTGKSIDEKLKELLDWLLENGGTGGGADLTETNNWLEKIYLKVSQIFDKMSGTAEGAADTVHAKIQETLDEMLVQIKKLKHWTMADTMVGAADAAADWLDFLKDLFSGADGAAEGVVGAISTTMDDAAQLMKTKFPFCIPWDVYIIVNFLAEEPQTPVFRLPIKLERLGIEEYIEVDLKDFSVVSSISRTLLTLLYCYALLSLTMKVFPITKEGGD